MMPAVIVKLLATLAILCQLAPLGGGVPSSVSSADTFPQGKAEWEPEAADVAMISRTIWGETRGCCEAEQRAQAWCILNRVDDPRFPDSIEAVVTAPNQFQGYSPNVPAEDFWDMAREILILWHNGEREIPADMCWCSGDGKHQTFRNSWERTAETRYWP